MVEKAAPDLDTVFRALADPTRREMLRRLARKEHRVTDLAAPFQMSLAAASKHIRTLERAGLLRRTVRGRTHICRLAPEPLARAQRWLERYRRFWSRRLDALERELRAEAAPPAETTERETRTRGAQEDD
jgi:DNA-binding transcriptional ArsR family regulator